MADETEIEDSSLLLAAEECPRDQFDRYHTFTRYEKSIIQKLIAHGPVLLRGGRGSGKSAILIQTYLETKKSYSDSIVPVYISLRHLPLLKSEGPAYIANFCRILSSEINKELRNFKSSFPIARDVGSLLEALEANARNLNRRFVLLFDDAAHIGRERPLIEFFDIFRTISTSRVSCKAAIYPGVTKFGVRFDVYNDATVVDISRDDRKVDFEEIFIEILDKRFSPLSDKVNSSRSITKKRFARILGRAVTGNLRSFVFACNHLNESESIGYNELTKCLLFLSGDYFWPLLEEVAPKLGTYEVLVQPAQEVAQFIFNNCAKKESSYCLVHKDIIQRQSKIFEILEYAGFFSRREASRALKSGGRGMVLSANLCNLLEATPGRRLTSELSTQWLDGSDEPFELHSLNPDYSRIVIPDTSVEVDLSIFARPIDTLQRSNAYPYGLTEDKIWRLNNAGLDTIQKVAEAGDEQILSIHFVGPKSLKRIRDVVYQAIWM